MQCLAQAAGPASLAARWAEGVGGRRVGLTLMVKTMLLPIRLPAELSARSKIQRCCPVKLSA